MKKLTKILSTSLAIFGLLTIFVTQSVPVQALAGYTQLPSTVYTDFTSYKGAKVYICKINLGVNQHKMRILIVREDERALRANLHLDIHGISQTTVHSTWLYNSLQMHEANYTGGGAPTIYPNIRYSDGELKKFYPPLLTSTVACQN